VNPSLQYSMPRLDLHLFIELLFRGDLDGVLKERRRYTSKNSHFRAFLRRKNGGFVALFIAFSHLAQGDIDTEDRKPPRVNFSIQMR
jgi:hypothetical protein